MGTHWRQHLFFSSFLISQPPFRHPAPAPELPALPPPASRTLIVLWWPPLDDGLAAVTQTCSVPALSHMVSQPHWLLSVLESLYCPLLPGAPFPSIHLADPALQSNLCSLISLPGKATFDMAPCTLGAPDPPILMRQLFHSSIASDLLCKSLIDRVYCSFYVSLLLGRKLLKGWGFCFFGPFIPPTGGTCLAQSGPR